MARTPKPWFRVDRGAWYAQVQGRQVSLAVGKENKKEAEQALRLLLIQAHEAKTEPDAYRVDWVIGQLLSMVKREKAPLTYEWYVRHLATFENLFASVLIHKLEPGQVEQWLAVHPGWSQATRRGAITAVKRLTRWARKQKYLAVDPLADVEKPAGVIREESLTPSDFDRVAAAINDQAFRSLVNAMFQTGCRIGEVATLTAKDVNLTNGTWSVVNKTRNKGDARRTIYLTDRLVGTCRTLIKIHPSGPIFLNMRGRPWTRNAVALRFKRLRIKLGMGREATSHALRKLFVTDALEKEVPIATVAELVGHKDTTMVAKVYSRLSQRREYLRGAVDKIRGETGKPAD